VRIILRWGLRLSPQPVVELVEGKGVDFVFALARNQRLRMTIGAEMQQAKQQWQ